LGSRVIAIVILNGMLAAGRGPQVKQLTLGAGTEAYPVVSPDGKWLAYERLQDDDPEGTEIWIMSTDKGFQSARRVTPNGQFSSGPSWSTDSHWISFAGAIHLPNQYITHQLYKTNIITGEAVQLTHTSEKQYHAGIGIHPAWSQNGWIAFAMDGDIYGVKENGGEVVQLLKVQPGEGQDRELDFLAWSPDSKHIAFDVREFPKSGGDRADRWAAPEKNSIWIGDIDSGSIRRVSSGPWDMSPQWIDARRLLFVRGSKADKKFNICILDVPSGKVAKLTSGYVDWLPHVTPDGLSIVFSRLKDIPKGHGFDFLFGSHIFQMQIPNSISSLAPAADKPGHP